MSPLDADWNDPLQTAYHDRLVELMKLEKRVMAEETDWSLGGRGDRRANAVLYLMRRAKRPLYQALKARYLKIWGKRASFSYFFPQWTTDPIWRAARETFKAQTA